MMDDSDVVRLQFICTSQNSAILIEQLSPTSLAYIGDAVYELYIRTHFLWPPKKISLYHDQVVSKVRAEFQAACLGQLKPYLTETEQEILRRGRNGVKREPSRLSPKLYQEASSLETLIGYLYLSNPQRLNQLLEKLKLDEF
ncbi:Mini-ribonuclease 3 [Chroococcus sp. FPU101]|uniref:Mini-ribonuclease 3 n=1 Tax=Chroococcus sp. FPU101 TaxID=1974212 RepID=UPI001AA2CAD4|nr:ribonuclease III domain-containing protein [Chroococcus sp. FPU101]GFE67590.1 ribonuclease III [Chroococcus sp. FPU101]